jgi:hypothetical protein
MKKCTKCLELKHIDSFTGTQVYCIDCTSRYNHEYYLKHAETIKARLHERYANDAAFRSARREYMKDYRARKAGGQDA